MFQILYEGEVFADYFQFYLRDEDHDELPDDYTDEVVARYLMVGPHAIVVRTVRNMSVPVRVEWHDQRPLPDLDSYQHVVEASLDCQSGQLLLAGMTDYEPESPRLAVKAGSLGLRLCLSGLDSLSEDELEGDDRYLVQFWPGPEPEGLRMLKAWQAK
jgi:hypothetical protein